MYRRRITLRNLSALMEDLPQELVNQFKADLRSKNISLESPESVLTKQHEAGLIYDSYLRITEQKIAEITQISYELH